MKSYNFLTGAVYVISAVLILSAPTRYAGAGEGRANPVNTAGQYARGVALIEQSALTQGRAIIEPLVKPGFILGDYAALDLALLDYDNADYRSALAHLDFITKHFKHTPLAKRVSKWKILSACADVTSRKCGWLLRWAGHTPGEFAPKRLMISAERKEADGDPVAAYKLYQRVYYSYPVSDSADKAKAATARLRKSSPASVIKNFPYATFKQRFKRVNRLAAGRRYQDAISDIKRTLTIGYSKKRKMKLRFTLGVTLQKARKRVEARQVFENIVNQKPSGKTFYKSLYNIARTDWNMNQPERAMTELKRLTAGEAGARLKSKAYFTMGRICESNGDYESAVRFYKKSLKQNPTPALGNQTRWKIGWIAYTQGRFASAEKLFDTALKKRKRGEGNGRLLYWRMRSLEKSGKTDEATETCQLLTKKFPHTYYGARLSMSEASFPHGAIKKADYDMQPPPVTQPPVKLSKRASFHHKRAVALLEIGLHNRAQMEIDSLYANVRKKLSALTWLGGLYREAEAPYKALRAQAIGLDQRDRKDDFDASFWKLYYPTSYWPDVWKQASIRVAAPFLILAIIRQESAFERNAVSSSNARGLMQLLPSTAEEVYRKIFADGQAVAPFDPDKLFDPSLNVTLGVAYFAGLMKRYDNRPYLAIAAYNAGHRPVDKWIEKFAGQAEDEFIENIPYPETRQYVKRVMRNRRMYSLIYSRPAGAIHTHSVVQYKSSNNGS